MLWHCRVVIVSCAGPTSHSAPFRRPAGSRTTASPATVRACHAPILRPSPTSRSYSLSRELLSHNTSTSAPDVTLLSMLYFETYLAPYLVPGFIYTITEFLSSTPVTYSGPLTENSGPGNPQSLSSEKSIH